MQKFAVFVMSDDLGSMIKECNPPPEMAAGQTVAELGVNVNKATRIMKNAVQRAQKKPGFK